MVGQHLQALTLCCPEGKALVSQSGGYPEAKAT